MLKTLTAQQIALLELWLAGALWGFGFIATRWGLESFAPFTLVSLRFLLVGAAGGLTLVFWPRLRRSTSVREFRACFWPGLWLAATLVLQGMGLEHTTVARAGFLSALYVVWIPFFERRGPIAWGHWLCVIISLAGAALICELRWDAPLNRGDLFVIACSITATLHIFSIATRVHQVKSAFSLNLFQSVWAGVFAAPFALLWDWGASRPMTFHGILGLVILSFGATLIAFAIQVRAQRILRASTVSLFFLLESPFAAVFAWYFFREALTLGQWIGGGLILSAAVYSLQSGSGEAVQAERLSQPIES